MISAARKFARRIKRKGPVAFNGWKILRGDTVEVTAGKHRGARGPVVNVLRDEQRVIVQGVNMSKRFIAATENSKGRIVEAEKPIHISNLSLIDPKSNKPTRVNWVKQEDGSLARVSSASNSIIPRPVILEKRRKPKAKQTAKCTSPEDVLSVSYVPFEAKPAVVQSTQ